MSLLLKFFLKSIKTDIKSELKYLFLSIIVLSFWFFVVSMPSITAFSEVGPYQVAQFDLFVTGPISEEFAKKLENSGNLVVKGKIIGGVEVCGQSGNCRKLDLFIVDNLTKALELTEINSAYLKESIGNGGAIIDVATAKKLNVELGSYVTIQVKNVTENVEITGILFPTSASRNRIVVDERAVKNIADMFRGYSSLWVKLSNKSDKGDVALIADELYFVAKRTEILDKKKAELDNLQVFYECMTALKLVNTTLKGDTMDKIIDRIYGFERDGYFCMEKDCNIVEAQKETMEFIEVLNYLNTEPKNKESLVEWLKSQQNSDGGFGLDNKSNILSTYFVVKSLKILGETPENPDGVLEFLERCKRKVGGFSFTAEDEKPTIITTYYGVKTARLIEGGVT